MKRSSLLCLLVVACGSPAVEGPDAASMTDAGRNDAALAYDTGADAPSATLDSGIDAPAIDSGSDASSDVGTDGGSDLTTLRIVYPAGHTITVRGSGAPLSWTTGMATTFADGVYELRIHGLASTIELKPLLDDDTSWSLGANYHVSPGQTVEIQPRFHTNDGRVETLLTWTSSALGNSRAIYVYLPAAYDENTSAHFPVLYMHDGQNLFDPSLAFGGNEWRVDETMNAAGLAGLCADGTSCTNDGACATGICTIYESTIVVGIANTANRIGEYTPTTDATVPGGGMADAYLDAVTSDLRPQIDAMLRTRTDRASTGMMGSSLGGLVSAHAGVGRSATFGLIGAMSPSTWWDSDEILGEVATIPSLATRALRVYVDCGAGTADGQADTDMLDAAYVTAGFAEGTTLHYVVQPGGMHNEVYWAQRLPGALAFLLPPRERAVP